jgi:hypothetical protein
MPNGKKKENNQIGNKPSLPSIRTFKTDIAETLKSRKKSLTDIYLSQRKQRRSSTEPTKKTPPKALNRMVVALIILLIIGGASAGIFWFVKDRKTPKKTPMTKTAEAFLPAQQKLTLIASTGAHLKTQIKNLLQKDYQPGDLIHLLIKKDSAYLNAKQFLSLLEAEAPSMLTGFIEEAFFLSILNIEEKHPALIFEIPKGYYSNAFSGMLRWEKQMTRDLSFITKGSATSASPVFQDEILKNQSARVVKQNNQIVFLYSVFNEKYIIITDSPEALEEIIRRFTLYKF